MAGGGMEAAWREGAATAAERDMSEVSGLILNLRFIVQGYGICQRFLFASIREKVELMVNVSERSTFTAHCGYGAIVSFGVRS